MIMNTRKKRSIQARVAHAILVKGLPGHRIESLKREGVFTLGGSSLDQSLQNDSSWKVFVHPSYHKANKT